MNKDIQNVTNKIIECSKPYRETYLQRLDDAKKPGVNCKALGYSNLAHGFAACSSNDKSLLSGDITPNIAIVSAYNDWMSQPDRKSCQDLILVIHISNSFLLLVQEE
jgi:phosphogluconate dehydratase